MIGNLAFPALHVPQRTAVHKQYFYGSVLRKHTLSYGTSISGLCMCHAGAPARGHQHDIAQKSLKLVFIPSLTTWPPYVKTIFTALLVEQQVLKPSSV